MLPQISPHQTYSWQGLKKHYQVLSTQQIQGLFRTNKQRFEQFSLKAAGLMLDYSKNHITKESCTLLFSLAEELHLDEAKEALRTGVHINATEDRAALHHALRAPVYTPNNRISRQIAQELDKMRHFCKALHNKQLRGFTNKPIDTIINIGIGGSDLGSRMVCEALRPFHVPGVRVHFVTNLDPADILGTLAHCDPQHTLFLISSKTFQTAETMSNATLAKKWFLQATHDKQHISLHFAAISAAEGPVKAFGITAENTFRLWDWVGGRFSLWSSIGLPIACAVGFERFEELLAGGYAMDKHFFDNRLAKNMPTILALLSFWYGNFYDAHTHAVLCYAQHLQYFVPFLQQMSMESNGKSINRVGHAVSYPTAPVLWGGVGTNGQHAFHQLLHQGTAYVPCDFIIPLTAEHTYYTHHKKVLSHCFAQSCGLMCGKDATTWRHQLQAQGVSEIDIMRSLPHRSCPGNKPSNTILMERLNPRALGALIVLYEHKTYVEGILWNIHSFDQWGVVMGKNLSIDVDKMLQNDNTDSTTWDSSTQGLVAYAKRSMSGKTDAGI